MRPVHWILLGISGVLASSVAIERNDRLWGMWLVGGWILAAGAVVAGVRLNRTRERKPWYFIAIAARWIACDVGVGAPGELAGP